MDNHKISDYSFEALCLHNGGPKINTLAYLVGLVDTEAHEVSDPDSARYNILYPLSHAEGNMPTPEDLVDWQSELLPENYSPQTPVMFVKRWSPIEAMLNRGLKPVKLGRYTEKAPHAVASGIWRPSVFKAEKGIKECKTDEELFWAILQEAFRRAQEKNWLVNVIAQVGWSYETQIGSLHKWSEKQIAKSGRILWKATVEG